MNKTGVGIGVIVLGLVGLVLAGQSTSLMQGTGTIWMGVAIVGIAVAVAFIAGAATWAKAVACVLLALAGYCGFYMENALDQQRDKIFNSSSYIN